MTDLPLEGEAFSAGAILGLTFALLRRTALRVAIALLVLGALGAVIDTGAAGPDADGPLNLLASVAALVVQYRLIRLLLGDIAGEPLAGAGFGGFFVVGLVAGIGILAGLLLLVVPGIILMVRWSISTPIVLATDEGAIDSLRRSWRETEGRFWPIFLAYLAVYLPGVALAVLGTALMADLAMLIPGAVIFNLALNGALIAGWYAAVAIYSLVERPAALSEVFE